ncbi:hypothetical protein ACFXKG_18575 [Streptomyces sp. NPDC059255]|uniref:hypothetical protein n=1 Tax=Streptomyces sp. NPDC059255 TaxID=3346793 RepID=UPI0036B3133F
MTFAPRTWGAGEIVSAAQLNQEIRDQLNSMFDAWTSWTPTWTAVTTNPSLGNGTLNGRYMKWGRTCMISLELTCGSTTTYGAGAWSFSLPFGSATGVGHKVGLAHAVGSIRVAGHTLIAPNAPNFQCFFPASGSVSNLNNAGAANPFTWAATNLLRVTLTYETAT